jgi:hypothetical protein
MTMLSSSIRSHGFFFFEEGWLQQERITTSRPPPSSPPSPLHTSVLLRGETRRAGAHCGAHYHSETITAQLFKEPVGVVALCFHLFSVPALPAIAASSKSEAGSSSRSSGSSSSS